MYRFAMGLLRGVLAAALLVAAFATTATAAPAPRKDDPAETRFVLYLFEECFRDTWSTADSGNTYSPSVRASIAQRERVIQDVTARVREAKLGGEHNTELIEALELYLKLVRDEGEKHAKDLDGCMDHIVAKYVELFGKANEAAARARWRGANETLTTTSSFLDRTRDWDRFDALGGVLILAMISEAKTQNEINAIRKRFDADFKKYLKGEGKEKYLAKAEPVTKKFVERFAKALAEHKRKAESLARTIAAERKWKAAETPFGEVKPEERLHDVFAQLRRIAAEPVTTDRGETRQANDLMEKAKQYLKAAKDVPPVNDRAYNYFRARCYGEAGREANRAAVLLGGSGGFSARKPNDASKLALQAWTQFKANNDRDLTGEVLYNYALALAYNGRRLDAYALVKGVKPALWPKDQAFHYDLARITALAAADVAISPAVPARDKKRRVSLLLQDSSMALETAVWLGFTDFARARETADLQPLREAGPDLLLASTFPRKQYRTFDQIVGDK